MTQPGRNLFSASVSSGPMPAGLEPIRWQLSQVLSRKSLLPCFANAGSIGPFWSACLSIRTSVMYSTTALSSSSVNLNVGMRVGLPISPYSGLIVYGARKKAPSQSLRTRLPSKVRLGPTSLGGGRTDGRSRAHQLEAATAGEAHGDGPSAYLALA